MIDPHFALDQQARIDYAYNALDKTTLLAKALIARFYGQAPRRSYFVGCSNGGRQALMAAERLPLEFDGIVAGDPSFRLTRTNVDEAWNEIVLARAAPKDAQGRPIISQALIRVRPAAGGSGGPQRVRRPRRPGRRHDQ